MKLVIFDLDQTLVDVLPVHDAAAEQVFQEFFGVKARLTETDFSGRSLIENFTELARLKGIPEEKVRENSRELLARYDERFVETFPQDPSPYILPGVRRLLEGLAQAGHLIALYTGDSARVADKALEATSLARYFRIRTYGTEVKARADMIRLATDKAEGLTGRRFQDGDVVVIGDSVRDIDAGKQFHAVTIAVATGAHSIEELSRHGPDHLFKDLSDYEGVIAAIG